MTQWIRTNKRIMIYERDSHRCVYCGGQLRTERYFGKTLDHVVPRKHGGSNEANNLVTSCLSCNQEKGDEAPDRYYVNAVIRHFRRIGVEHDLTQD